MKNLLLLPALAGALLFSGCEATLVDATPHRYGPRYGYVDRGYYRADGARDYRYRSDLDDPYYRRSSSYYRSGYVNTRPVYATPHSSYGHSRAIYRTQTVTPRAPLHVTVVKGGHSGNKKSHKKGEDRDHR